MSHCVPYVEAEDDEPAAAPLRRKAPSSFDEDLWRKGPPAQLSPAKLPSDADAAISGRVEPVFGGAVGSSSKAAELFMEEDEMVAWLHYQIAEEEVGQLAGSSLGPGSSAAAAAAEKPGAEDTSETLGVAAPAEPGPSTGRTCEHVVASSSAESGAAQEERSKRKASAEPSCHSEDADFESGDRRKDNHQSASARRTRAVEVHNLSERRRRDRINEKMKALQELLPRCNKSDKASMLDDAIEYLKSLQLQVQMMAMGSNMGPVMYPGMQTYLPPMAMGMNMGVGMGMGTGIPIGNEMGAVGLGCPMLPFRHVFTGPTVPGASSVSLGARPFMPSMHPSHTDQLRIQASNQQDSASNSTSMHSSSTLQLQNAENGHHPHANSHGLQTQPQSRAMAESRASKDFGSTEKPK